MQMTRDGLLASRRTLRLAAVRESAVPAEFEPWYPHICSNIRRGCTPRACRVTAAQSAGSARASHGFQCCLALCELRYAQETPSGVCASAP